MSTAAHPATMAAIADANLRSMREAIEGSVGGLVKIPGSNLLCTVAEAIVYRDSLQAQRDALAEMAEVRRELGLSL